MTDPRQVLQNEFGDARDLFAALSEAMNDPNHNSVQDIIELPQNLKPCFDAMDAYLDSVKTV